MVFENAEAQDYEYADDDCAEKNDSDHVLEAYCIQMLSVFYVELMKFRDVDVSINIEGLDLDRL